MINELNQPTPPVDGRMTNEPAGQNNEDTINTLNGLIETCKDGQEGFKQAAEGVERSDLKSLFFEFSQQRSKFAGELQDAVRTLGGDPENSGSIAGSLHRGWMNIKTAVSGNDEAAILNECERGEDSAKNAYKEALESSLPAYIQTMVQDQYSAVLNAHDRVKALRDAYNEGRSIPAGTNR